MNKKFNLENNEILKNEFENKMFNEITEQNDQEKNKSVYINIEQKEIKSKKLMILLKASSYEKIKKYSKKIKISVNELINRFCDSL